MKKTQKICRKFWTVLARIYHQFVFKHWLFLYLFDPLHEFFPAHWIFGFIQGHGESFYFESISNYVPQKIFNCIKKVILLSEKILYFVPTIRFLQINATTYVLQVLLHCMLQYYHKLQHDHLCSLAWLLLKTLNHRPEGFKIYRLVGHARFQCMCINVD
jgi:hypothetical protein